MTLARSGVLRADLGKERSLWAAGTTAAQSRKSGRTLLPEAAAVPGGVRAHLRVSAQVPASPPEGTGPSPPPGRQGCTPPAPPAAAGQSAGGGGARPGRFRGGGSARAGAALPFGLGGHSRALVCILPSAPRPGRAPAQGVCLNAPDPAKSEKAVLHQLWSQALHQPMICCSVLDQVRLCYTGCPPRNLGRKSLYRQGHPGHCGGKRTCIYTGSLCKKLPVSCRSPDSKCTPGRTENSHSTGHAELIL